jgi:signal peptidase I
MVMDNSSERASAHESARRETRPAGIGRILAVVILILILGRTFLVDLVLVQGRSMLPGLGSGDIVVIFKAAYGLRNPSGGYLLRWGRPENGDIVAAFRPDTGKVIIKRVRTEGAGPVDKAIGEGKDRKTIYFLLGDNKYESIDSREFGPVPMNNILGKALLFPHF